MNILYREKDKGDKINAPAAWLNGLTFERRNPRFESRQYVRYFWTLYFAVICNLIGIAT
jgi:hypothetical protein